MEIKRKPKLVIFSGAGLSAESGISTFRDAGGLWENHKIEDVCTFSTWRKNYNLVHEFYNQRRLQLNEVEPNKAHNLIAIIQKEFKDIFDVKIITQNVDDLLERAGCEEVLHVHGFLPEVKCVHCNEITYIGYKETDTINFACKCGCKTIKPNIVFFGEAAPNYYEMYENLNTKLGDVVIVIGTDGSVVPIDVILDNTKSTNILINLNKSEYISDKNFKYIFEEPATKAIVKVYDILQELKGKM